MSAKFTEKEKEKLRIEMMQLGFVMLKSGGIRNVNIDTITKKCFVAKGSFYTLFENKTEFLYQIMIYKRKESKVKIKEYLSDDGKLSRKGLKSYLHWLADENPNIFSYLDGQHTRWLVSKWPPEYLENEENDEQTARRIISMLAAPKKVPDWQLFCNYLKLLALTLNSREFLIEDATEPLIDNLIEAACDCICK
ncbi:MAG: TetR/AcrR family transcriptional regulator [Lachnospiraceae bacterium]|nr:TetR/AcrR family transcriptional regulator [Lachnospiraceae bacterium]